MGIDVPQRFFRLTSEGRSIWATRSSTPLPLDYRRVLGVVEYCGHEAVIKSQLGRFSPATVEQWLDEFEAMRLIELVSDPELHASPSCGDAVPPFEAEDLADLECQTALADISLSGLGVHISTARVAHRPRFFKPPGQTLALVVEDDPDQRVLAQRRLRSAGYRTDAVDCVQALFQFLRQRVPDCIILDINLPDGDGFEVLGRLRRAPAFTLLPIILLTSRSDRSDITKGLALGADGYVIKSFYKPNTLDYVLRCILKQEAPLLSFPAAHAGAVPNHGSMTPLR